MKIIKQIFIILFFYVIGESLSFIISSIFPKIFIPGTILGLFIFLIVLLNEKIKMLTVDDVDEVGTFLTNNMAFFFIPAAVSVMEYFDILKATFLKIIVIIVISLLIMFFVIAYVVKLTLYLQNKIQTRGEAK